MEPNLKNYAIKVLNGIGIKAGEEAIGKQYVSNQITTNKFIMYGVEIEAVVTNYEGKTCGVEVNLSLPGKGATAKTFMDHCAGIENIPKNIGHQYCYGPRYRDYSAELNGKNTTGYSPWDNHYLCVVSKGYKISEIDEAVENCTALAGKFIAHLPELASIRYWNTSDEEVIAKAKEIIANADFHETDVDREEKAHWLEDRNSFFHGWFSPFNKYGKGSFDTLWPASVDYAARNMGNRGSFEYAVSCILLEDPEYIAKARKACVIRKETRTIEY